MKQKNAKEFLPLVQALAEGKLQMSCCTANGYREWRDIAPVTDIEFGSDLSLWRIKPEPKKTQMVPISRRDLPSCPWFSWKTCGEAWLPAEMRENGVFHNGQFFTWLDLMVTHAEFSDSHRGPWLPCQKPDFS